jgi:hypothetical protein
LAEQERQYSLLSSLQLPQPSLQLIEGDMPIASFKYVYVESVKKFSVTKVPLLRQSSVGFTTYLIVMPSVALPNSKAFLAFDELNYFSSL